MAGDGGHVDDPAVALGLHDPHGPLGEEERAGDVDAVGAVPVLQGHLVKGDLVGDAGVVHQNVQRAEFLLQHLETVVHVRFRRHVAPHRHAAAGGICRHDLIRHGSGIRLVEVRDENACSTFLGELAAVARTHAGAASGDQGDLALQQLFHETSLLLCNGVLSDPDKKRREVKGPPGAAGLGDQGK